jgi:hypothetical protein
MASNTILTASVIAKEALAIIHEETNFITNIKRYDSEWNTNVNGYKKGETVRIRKPAQFTVVTATGLAATDFEEPEVSLQLSNQPHVDVSFTSKELTLELSEFSDRVLRPAMAKLASYVENDALSMVNEVGNAVHSGSALNWKNIVSGSAILDQHGAPRSGRCMLINPITQVNIVDATKGLFQDSGELAKQYKEGRMGRASGYDFYTNAKIPTLVNGDATTAVDLAESWPTTSTSGEGVVDLSAAVAVDLSAGQIFTIAGIFDVHPETKEAYSRLKQFCVATAVEVTGGATAVTLTDQYFKSGPRQNVSTSAAATAQVSPVGAVSTTFDQSIGFHKDAFAFASVPLYKPTNVEMAAVETYDGISIRMVKDYDITNDVSEARFDILYGYAMLREEWAVRYIDA